MHMCADVVHYTDAVRPADSLTSLQSLANSLVNHWLYSRAAMIGTRSLEDGHDTHGRAGRRDDVGTDPEDHVPVVQVTEVQQVELSGVLSEIDGVHVLKTHKGRQT